MCLVFIAFAAPAVADCRAQGPEQIAKAIAAGHAYSKHVEGVENAAGREFTAGAVIDGRAFPPPGIGTRADFAAHVRLVLESAEHAGLARRRHKYWQDTTGTIVITDPRSNDCGTAFRPDGGMRYYRRVN